MPPLLQYNGMALAHFAVQCNGAILQWTTKRLSYVLCCSSIVFYKANALHVLHPA